MSKALEYLILAGLIVSALVCAWSVLTVNHLTIG
ncbi:hypothetical protein [Campylobacter avium]|nr:hypothetical protein [Campylobacter avium]HJE66636.1 hypothetical protein [Campylobacter avium]